jgi:hypothetical protein
MTSEKIKEYLLQIASNVNKETRLDDIYEQLALLNDIDESEEGRKEGRSCVAPGSDFPRKPMVKIIWTKRAFDQLERAINYISKKEEEPLMLRLFWTKSSNQSPHSQLILN